MTLDERIYRAVQALLATRAYPRVAPDNVARPYLVFADISTTGSYTLSQVGNTDRCRVQVDVYADNTDELQVLAKAVRTALQADGFRLADKGSAYEPDTRLHRVRLDFYVWHRPEN